MTSFHHVLQIMLAKLMISLDITLFLHFFLAECVFFDKKINKTFESRLLAVLRTSSFSNHSSVTSAFISSLLQDEFCHDR